MKVVLVEVVPEKDALTMNLVPPLGLGYIASSLEAAGFSVTLIDGVRYDFSLDKALELIKQEKPDVVGFSATTQARLKAAELIRRVKVATRALTVAGGAHFHATCFGALAAIPELDVVVKGEGEITLPELARAFAGKGDFGIVNGIVYRDNGRIVETRERAPIADLDALPMPAYHLYNLSKYTCTLEGTKIPAIGVISSRGCPNNCIFCANRVLRKQTLRFRSPSKFVDEIAFLKRTYGYQAFDFWDDTLTMSKEHVTAICQELLKRKLAIRWFARARVNTVSKNILALMKKSGCFEIAYGIESGSEKILKVINKGATLQQAREAVRLAVEAGLRVSNFFIVSLPEETLNDIDETLKTIGEFRRLKNTRNYYCFAMIYPGTDLEARARQEKLLPDNFNWHAPFFCERNKIVGNDPTIPCYERRELTLEQIKVHIIKSQPLRDKTIKALKRLYRIRSLSEARKLIGLFLKSSTDE